MPLLLLFGLTLLLQAPDLIVTVHDTTGAPLVGATITVQEADGQVLAQAATDQSGTATFDRLPMSDVRVQLAGQLADGTALRLMPTDVDAGGIRVYLTNADQLTLIVEPDGTIILDPATMWALEPGGPVTPTTTLFPTAPLAPAGDGGLGERTEPVRPTGAPAGIAAPPVPTPQPLVAEPAAQGLTWLPALLLGVLLAALGGLLLRRGRGR